MKISVTKSVCALAICAVIGAGSLVTKPAYAADDAVINGHTLRYMVFAGKVSPSFISQVLNKYTGVISPKYAFSSALVSATCAGLSAATLVLWKPPSIGDTRTLNAMGLIFAKAAVDSAIGSLCGALNSQALARYNQMAPELMNETTCLDKPWNTKLDRPRFDAARRDLNTANVTLNNVIIRLNMLTRASEELKKIDNKILNDYYKVNTCYSKSPTDRTCKNLDTQMDISDKAYKVHNLNVEKAKADLLVAKSNFERQYRYIILNSYCSSPRMRQAFSL